MSDRKYRHSGYQDDDRDRGERSQRPSRPRREPGDYSAGPRGRGVGSSAEVSFMCANCGRQQQQPSIGRDDTCPGCGKPLHCCTNCGFFNPGARFECTKPLDARVESKFNANDCALFEPKAVRTMKADAGSPSKAVDPRDAFNNLFKK